MTSKLNYKGIVSLKVYRKSKVKIGSKDQRPGHEIIIIQALTKGERPLKS